MKTKTRRQCKQNSIYRVFGKGKHRNYCGDEVKINGQVIGKIAGFDETHMPNHYNIVIYGTDRISGNERNLDLNDEVVIG